MKAENGTYRVPEGYFTELNARLSAIPEMSGQPQERGGLRPYLALVASFAGIAVVGGLIMHGTMPDASRETSGDEQYMMYVSESHPYSFYGAENSAASTVSYEDVVNYLIEGDFSAENLEYLAYNE